jgi:hypothetical protein
VYKRPGNPDRKSHLQGFVNNVHAFYAVADSYVGSAALAVHSRAWGGLNDLAGVACISIARGDFKWDGAFFQSEVG